MHWILNITYGEVINGLDNKSITTHGFTSWSVSIMISSLTDYTAQNLEHVTCMLVTWTWYARMLHNCNMKA